MAFKLKATVELRSLQPQMVLAALVVKDALDYVVLDTIITSGSDSHTTGLHPLGTALDFRTKHIALGSPDRLTILLGLIGRIAEALRSNITPEQRGNTYIWGGQLFDLLLENFGEDNEHLHVEYQPK